MRYSVSKNCWLGGEFWIWNMDEEDKGELLLKLFGFVNVVRKLKILFMKSPRKNEDLSLQV